MMPSILRNRLTLVIGVALLLRVLLFLIYRPWDAQVEANAVIVNGGDARIYHDLALCIVEHFSFCGQTFRTPAYPLFVASIYGVFGIKPWLVLLAQIVLDLVEIYIVFKLGRLLISERAGLIAASFLAIDPNQIMSTSSLLSDGLFVTFLLGSVYCFFAGLKGDLVRYLMLSGLLLALATLTRPITQPYMLIMIVFLLLWSLVSKKASLNRTAIFVLSFMVGVSPWLYRNYTLYDAIGLSTAQGENLLFWQVGYARVWKTGQTASAVTNQLTEQARALGYDPEKNNPFVNESIARHLALDYLSKEPSLYASRWLRGILHMYANLDTARIAERLGLASTRLPAEAMQAAASEGELVSKFFRSKSTLEIAIGVLVMSLLVLNYCLLVLGLNYLLRHREVFVLAFFTITIVWFSFAGGIIGQARYRVPVTPFCLLIGAAYVDSVLARRWKGKAGAAASRSGHEERPHADQRNAQHPG